MLKAMGFAGVFSEEGLNEFAFLGLQWGLNEIAFPGLSPACEALVAVAGVVAVA